MKKTNFKSIPPNSIRLDQICLCGSVGRQTATTAAMESAKRAGKWKKWSWQAQSQLHPTEHERDWLNWSRHIPIRDQPVIDAIYYQLSLSFAPFISQALICSELSCLLDLKVAPEVEGKMDPSFSPGLGCVWGRWLCLSVTRDKRRIKVPYRETNSYSCLF